MPTVNRTPTRAARPPAREAADARPPWHALGREALVLALDSGPLGLSRAEAEARLARHGPNRLEEAPPTSDLALLLRQFTSPLIYILLLATIITVLLGDLVDAGVIAAVLALNALIGFTQERRAEASVRALMRLVPTRARVIRDGQEWEVRSEDLVPGDLVLLESGAHAPADVRLVSTTALMADESLLTGESVPAAKEAVPLPAEAGLADRRNMAYTGAVVTSGRGRGYVVATGRATELGGIARDVRGRERPRTPLQRRMARFARLVTGVVAASALLAFGIGILKGEPAAQMFLVAVALGVSAVPEGLPVALTITLALGVRRMARRNAVIRRLAAVETLGSTTVIGSDKTGTLTENRMTVQVVWAGGRTFAVGGEAPLGAELAEHRPLYLTALAGVLASEAELYRTEEGLHVTGDPTEGALLVAAARMGIEHEAVRAEYAPYAEVPFEPERRYSASVRVREGTCQVFVKGAPERVLAMCGRMLTDEGVGELDRDAVRRTVAAMAVSGLRVLAMAHRVLPGRPPALAGRVEPEGLVLAGLVGMMDPPRAGVREAISGCREAGIRVVMITGDHADTARAIGRDLGIVPDGAEVLSGTDIERMDDAALRRRVGEVAVYARVAPEQKLRLVLALRRLGEVVAVTGDGVNDAPALKAADIGIAMGRSGTDVAREAADMVLADDDFVSIYAAVEEGRVAFDNVRKVTFFLVSTGAAEILTILTAVLLDWPLPFLPAQLLWLNLVTNGLQDVALAFEPGEPGVLLRPPRSPREGIVSRLLWEQTVVAGLVMAAGTLSLFHWSLAETGSIERAQTAALTTMVLFQAFHVGNSRSARLSLLRLSPVSNRFLFAATLAALAVHVLALHAAPTQFVLRVEPIELATWARIVPVAATILAAMELFKLVQRKRGRG